VKKFATIALIITLFLIQSVNPVLARQGCCSHHSGVCGCHCCDGTPLSTTCAPYYPNCGRSVPLTNTAPTYPVYPVAKQAGDTNTKEWYQSGWTYLVGGILLYIGGARIKRRINKKGGE
jgi:hypothetical protein